ncbi:flagellar assembly protein FliW [Paenibacillus sp. WLX2291]|uniref:flagellar assembly protein FliW n=1 Tax=Paenibacillus sp. WLX2291 TaxID=3296934 RepID=UPI00398410EF
MSESQFNSNETESEQQKNFVFAKGIPGFPDAIEYTIMEYDHSFSVLQAVNQSEIGFIIVDPFKIYPDYEIELSQELIEELNINSENQVVIRNIVSWSEKLEDRTVNLVAPLVFNLDNRQARQIILQNTDYSIRHPLQQTQLKGD